MSDSKKIIVCAFIIYMIALLTTTSYAHPGRTDSNGGHYNNSTGEYHYHHGESAHDHYDIDGDGDLDCPLQYKYTDNIVSVEQSATKSSLSKHDIFVIICIVVSVIGVLAYLLNNKYHFW